MRSGKCCAESLSSRALSRQAVAALYAVLLVAIVILFVNGCMYAQQTTTTAPKSQQVASTASAGSNAFNVREADFMIKGFRFQSGEVLPQLRQHYTALGTPVRDAAGNISNAVILLHGTTGTGKNYLNPGLSDYLFKPGMPLDATRYFIILPDGIGRGGSSKPSDGMRMKFPKYGYSDVVEAEYRLCTEGLGIKHLRLVLGTSMGGMMTWMWGERYPEYMDGVVAIASQPVQLSGRNWLWRRLIIEGIRQDAEWNNGNYDKQPHAFVYFSPEFNIMTESPVRLQERLPTREQANQYYDQVVAHNHKVLDANDYLMWLESSYDYNPWPSLDKIQAPLLAINFADDALNPPELGIMETAVQRVKNGKLILVPASKQSRGHQTLNEGKIWSPYLTEFMGTLRNTR